MGSNLGSGGVVVTRKAPPELLNKWDHRRIPRVEQEDLLGSDDCLDMLEVDDDGPLSSKHGGRVREERVKDPKVAGGQAGAPHDGVLPGLDHLSVPRRVHEKPRPDPRCLLPVATTGADSEGKADRGSPGGVRLIFGLVETRLEMPTRSNHHGCMSNVLFLTPALLLPLPMDETGEFTK